MSKNNANDKLEKELVRFAKSPIAVDACGDYADFYMKDLEDLIQIETEKARQETAQEAYLEALLVECGEGEVARGIRTKFGLEGYKEGGDTK